jgi:ribonuclease HI
VPEAFEADRIQEEEAAARREAERPGSGLTKFTDRPRLDSGAAGYAATWQNGQHWVGIKTHMGYNQEAYDAERAAFARALETLQDDGQHRRWFAIFTDAQAAIRRMASEETGPG